MGASGVLLHDRPTCRVEGRFGHIDAASDDQLTTALRQTERHCVVFQTLRNPPPVAVSLQRVSA